MDHRENFQRMMRGQGPGRLPFEMWVTGPAQDLIERELGTRDQVAAFDLSFRSIYPAYPHQPDAWRAAYAALGVILAPDDDIAPLGHVHARPRRESLGSAYHLMEMRHPLAGVERVADLVSLPWPDLGDAALYASFSAQTSEYHAEGRAVIGQMQCTAFESAWYLRGMENLMLDLLEGGDISNWLLDWYTDRAVAAVRAYARAGVDMVLLGDDVGTQIGMMLAPEMWREHLAPRLGRVIRELRSAEPEIWIGYHSDGDIRAIVPDLIALGIDLLNPLQPECMPIDDIIGQYKDQIGFYGMIGTQSLMPFGTPAEVRAQVERLATWARSGARILLAPTHVIEPDVPWANLVALSDAVRTTRL